jgi:NTE family protein
VPFAIRASTCIPTFYAPVRDAEGRWLVDGGLVASLPIRHTRALGVDAVIASDVNFDGARFFEDPKTAIGVMAQVFVAVERIVANQDRDDADVLITPKVGHIRWDQTRRADELLRIGYETALQSMDKIKLLAQGRSRDASIVAV